MIRSRGLLRGLLCFVRSDEEGMPDAVWDTGIVLEQAPPVQDLGASSAGLQEGVTTAAMTCASSS
jgi:hypothetical protein